MLEDLFGKVKSRALPKSFSNKPLEVPTDLLFKCIRCQQVTLMEDFEANYSVCPKCGYHARLPVEERLLLTVDPNSFIQHDKHMKSVDPIEFPGYADKVRSLRKSTGLRDAIITGEAHICGQRCMIGIMDARFMMASMGSVVGEKIVRIFEYATENRLPVVLFTASGGARMQEGIISLMQMAKTSAAVARHSDAGLLYITVMTDPTTGGVTASFASLGDIIIAEPKVLIGFAGRRVIEGTIKQRLPDDFQSAEFLLEHGFVDRIVERSELRKTLGDLLKLHAGGETI